MKDRGTLVSGATRPRWVVAVGAAALAAAVWAAATPGAVRAITDPGRREIKQTGYDDTPNTLATEFLPERFVGPKRAAQGIEGYIGYVVVGGLALLIAFCIWAGIRQLVHRTQRPPLADAAPAVDVDLGELARVIASGEEERLAALSAGTPADGVMAAWALLEAAVHSAGLPLSAARTSSEVVVDVLGRFRVDDATLRSLAELYREARWSAHSLTEDDRARAAEAYRTLGAAVSAAAPGVPGGTRG